MADDDKDCLGVRVKKDDTFDLDAKRDLLELLIDRLSQSHGRIDIGSGRALGVTVLLEDQSLVWTVGTSWAQIVTNFRRGLPRGTIEQYSTHARSADLRGLTHNNQVLSLVDFMRLPTGFTKCASLIRTLLGTNYPFTNMTYVPIVVDHALTS
jgi:hypothetical protein